MAKPKQKQPANFVDLRPGAKRSNGLIQDIFKPSRRPNFYKFLNQRKLWLALVLVIVLILILQLAKAHNPLPANIKSQIHFTTFIPGNLPAGYTKPTNYSIDNNVLTFEVDTPQAKQVLISEQAEPANFDVDNFDHNQIKNKQIVNIKYGTAYLGNLEESQVGSLVNSGTWIFLSQPKQTGNTGDLVNILKSLSKY